MILSVSVRGPGRTDSVNPHHDHDHLTAAAAATTAGPGRPAAGRGVTSHGHES
jgi:hypothetical protein